MTDSPDHDESRLYLPSLCVVSVEARKCAGLSDAARIYLGELWVFANKFGYVYASDEQLADMKGVGLRTIKRWHLELETNGFIRRDTSRSHVKTERGVEVRSKRKIYIFPHGSKKDAEGPKMAPRSEGPKMARIKEEPLKKEQEDSDAPGPSAHRRQSEKEEPLTDGAFPSGNAAEPPEPKTPKAPRQSSGPSTLSTEGQRKRGCSAKPNPPSGDFPGGGVSKTPSKKLPANGAVTPEEKLKSDMLAAGCDKAFVREAFRDYTYEAILETAKAVSKRFKGKKKDAPIESVGAYFRRVLEGKAKKGGLTPRG